MAVAVTQIMAAYRNRFPKVLVEIAMKVRGYAEVTGYVAAAVAPLSAIGLALSRIFGKRIDLFDEKLGPETFQKLFRRDEPTIHTDKRKED